MIERSHNPLPSLRTAIIRTMKGRKLNFQTALSTINPSYFINKKAGADEHPHILFFAEPKEWSLELTIMIETEFVKFVRAVLSSVGLNGRK